MLFHLRFVSPIPSALYHPAKIRVDISLISTQFSRGVILLRKQCDISENGVISVERRVILPTLV